MTTQIKTIIVVLGITFVISCFGLVYPNVQQVLSVGGTNNAAGTTFNTAKIAQINITPATSSATSTSLLNTDSTDRIVSSSFAFCNTTGSSKTYLTGTGLSAFLVQMSTTSVASQSGNTNWIANDTIATSTVDTFVSSTTEGVIQGTSRVWPTGTYLTITFNATNTAVCTAGVHYIGS